MRIGFDVDGVLADFNNSFIERCIQVTGKDLFPPRPFDIPCWDYPEHYGYTREETSAIWASIKRDPYFWQSLHAYPEAYRTVQQLDWLEWNEFAEVYYVTARPGTRVKFQTEIWLEEGVHASYSGRKTVLISSHKGLVARALDLDVYIDDKWENCLDVVAATTPVTASADAPPKTRVFLLNQPWNTKYGNTAFVTRVDSPFEVFTYLEQQELVPTI